MDMSIIECAQWLFDEASAFKAFVAEKGISPEEYRAAHDGMWPSEYLFFRERRMRSAVASDRDQQDDLTEPYVLGEIEKRELIVREAKVIAAHKALEACVFDSQP